VIYLTYMPSELRSRKGRTLFTALGLARADEVTPTVRMQDGSIAHARAPEAVEA
jgi:hypothetical protein